MNPSDYQDPPFDRFRRNKCLSPRPTRLCFATVPIIHVVVFWEPAELACTSRIPLGHHFGQTVILPSHYSSPLSFVVLGHDSVGRKKSFKMTTAESAVLPRRLSTKRPSASQPKSRPNKRLRLAPASSDEDDDDDEECLFSEAQTISEPQNKEPPKADNRRKKNPTPSDSEEDDLALAENEKNQGRTFKEGQRVVCPPMGDPSRAFYESLIQEKPQSIIAIRWCIEHGVLIGSQHKLALKYYKALKAAGAFKPGKLGGLKTDFADSFQ
eukprot:Gregarina_sp_Poly_1__5890@NODE_30_length_19457_cov_61_697267_g27_i0_p6_GENE_NODE_30_length_19457_cov_61_697267_g27_i0NODE_30_length_19457_cov_61_697267_g27_i0_p6_ORF_typecomplete_len268_score36_49Spt5_N/PF11942_8/0_7_NODE_30_length_19457_cov_61_697267_g27_i024053208